MADAAMPRWDMTVVFPSLGSSEFSSALFEVDQLLRELEFQFENAPPVDDSVSRFDEILSRFNDLSAKLRVVNAYVTAFVTTDSRNEEALAKASEMDPLLSRLRKLGKQFTAWIGELDVEALIQNSTLACDHAYMIRKAKVGATHLLSGPEESLASDLELTGTVAWAKLHGNLTSQLKVTVSVDGADQSLPMSVVRGMATDASEENRLGAYRAELKGWKEIEVPIAAALNSIKGEVGLMSRKRGWESPLHEAVESNNIDIATLETMMAAAEDAFPIFRRYLKAKARALGKDQLRWFDLFAPLSSESKEWPYAESKEFIKTQFGTFSPRMSEYARRAFEENWIDAEPREGKRDGAYCMSIQGEISRILMNYQPSYDSVSTLAHELGHGYHNLCLAQRTPLQRSTPMTLAETASIFCETIVRQAVLNEGSPAEQLTILEASLQGTTQVVVDISSRFRFEKEVFARRRSRELSPREFCEIMLESQRSTYGDGLDPEFLHPYMWVVKGHYYGRSFYNYPYMFGLLFGLGLYAIYQKEPASFLARYDDMLSSTGLADAASLAKGFGIDIQSRPFWDASLDQIRQDVDRFERLTT